MKLCILVEKYLDYITFVRNFEVNTINNYKSDLNKIQNYLSPDIEIENITENDISVCMLKISNEYSNFNTINRFTIVLHNLFYYAVDFKYLNKDISSFVKVKKIYPDLSRRYTVENVKRICDYSKEHGLLWKQRDAALFNILYSSGARISEICNLSLKDLRDENSSAIVKGKGRNERQIFFGKSSVKLLNEYLIAREKYLIVIHKKENTDKIFLNSKGNPLKSNGAEFILKKYTNELKIDGITLHSFRHAFATTMLYNEVDIRIIQEFLGHKNINTTQIYTHVDMKRLIDIYKKFFPIKI